MRAHLVLGLALVLALGCGKKMVPVSGKVTLNGQPLVGATVSFQPVASGGAAEAGPGSAGKTNDNGEYTLTAATGQTGAWVGKHRVSITLLSPKVGEDDVRHSRRGPALADKVPARYNKDSKEVVEVPPGGMTKDFALTSP
ncbi:MAG TPA: hypothetical protein VFE78_15045 [Gemmataceae bacterium]|jgi:hypothetical protein|nr:hypothetical protein [Gemmataceae bacterium]